MTDLLSSSQFWLLISIGFYALGVEIQKKTGSAVCNPLLIASILVGALLIATGTSYQTYEESGKLIWRCPKCGNTDQDKMNVARRTCGYIGTQFWNQGRTQEIKDRVLHL